MSNYLNTNVLLENYKNLYRSKYFIDKRVISTTNVKILDLLLFLKQKTYFIKTKTLLLLKSIAPMVLQKKESILKL